MQAGPAESEAQTTLHIAITVTSWCRFGVAANESLPFLRCLVELTPYLLVPSNAKVGSHS